MKTLGIETTPDALIGGGIRLPTSKQLITTTPPGFAENLIRSHNLQRFDIEVKQVRKAQLKTILEDPDINLQLVTNNGNSGIDGLYRNPKEHPILMKTGIVKYGEQFPSFGQYLPNSFVIAENTLNEDNYVEQVLRIITTQAGENQKIILKHPLLDGGGSGVGCIDLTTNVSAEDQVKALFTQFHKKLGGDKQLLFGTALLIQECVENTIGEGSITFSIQNNGIENRGLANNIVMDRGFVGGSNYFPYMSPEQITDLEMQLEIDMQPLLLQLQSEGVRGNVGFDTMFQVGDTDNDDRIAVKVVEANGIYRPTGTTMPRSFAHNTGNKYFVGTPLGPNLLQPPYVNLDQESMLELADTLQSFGTKPGEAQIMNMRYVGMEAGGRPGVRIALAGPSIPELQELLLETNILNNEGASHAKQLFNSLLQSQGKK